MQDVDAKRSGFQERPAITRNSRGIDRQSHRFPAAWRRQSCWTTSIEQGTSTTPRFALDHKDPRRGEAGTSLRPAYYLACNMMWSSSTTRHVGWLRWVLTLWPDGLDAWNPFLRARSLHRPTVRRHGSWSAVVSPAPLRRRPLDRFSGHHSVWPAATRLVAARAFCRIDCALPRRDQLATLRSPNPVPC